MPIGKSEIVLKVQKCIPSRDGIHPDKKVVHSDFSALTVQAISWLLYCTFLPTSQLQI